MKLLFWIGLVVVALGVASLMVPVPHTEHRGIKAGDVNIGIDTRHDEKISPWISGVIIVGGISIMLAGSRMK